MSYNIWMLKFIPVFRELDIERAKAIQTKKRENMSGMFMILSRIDFVILWLVYMAMKSDK